MARAIREWAESGIVSEVRALHSADAGSRSDGQGSSRRSGGQTDPGSRGDSDRDGGSSR